jgi:hypothetical protein
MELPNLPKKYKRTEAKVDSLVAEKLMKKHPHRNWALEVKVKGGRLETHQKVALKQVENGTFKPYKIPDMGRQNPFDFFYLGDADAIVCVVDGKSVTCEVNSGVITYNFKI